MVAGNRQQSFMFEYRSGIEIHLMRKTHPDKGDEDEGEQRISSGLQKDAQNYVGGDDNVVWKHWFI